MVFTARLVRAIARRLATSIFAPGFYKITNIVVRGIDRRHWWSNGLTVKASRYHGPQQIAAFTTQKGEVDQSSSSILQSVHFAGSYTFEGHGSHPWM